MTRKDMEKLWAEDGLQLAPEDHPIYQNATWMISFGASTTRNAAPQDAAPSESQETAGPAANCPQGRGRHRSRDGR